MRHAAIRLLQVSAAYFAIGNTPAPGGAHFGNPTRPPFAMHRLAAGAWPMIALPIAKPRQPASDRQASLPPAANDSLNPG